MAKEIQEERREERALTVGREKAMDQSRKHGALSARRVTNLFSLVLTFFSRAKAHLDAGSRTARLSTSYFRRHDFYAFPFSTAFHPRTYPYPSSTLVLPFLLALES